MLRRNFLLSSALSGLATSVGASTVEKKITSITPNVSFISASESRLGEHSFVCFDKQMNILSEYDIGDRGHSFAYSSQGHIAAIARRPLDFCVILNSKGQKLREFTAQTNRHFYGHGVYSTNGDFLYLTENNYAYEGTRGVIGVYDVANDYQRIDELSTYGIGPHEIALNGEQLIVANGGIQTHPAMGRKKLNLDDMQPSLVHIDRLSGKLIHRSTLPDKYRQNSIRHMTLGSNGGVYLGLQTEAKSPHVCSVAYFNPETKALEKIPLSSEHQMMLNSYVGDICLDKSGQYLAVSAPRGSGVLFIDLINGQTQSVNLDDACGLAASIETDKQFIVSSGKGQIFLVDMEQEIKVTLLVDTKNLQYWDNHIMQNGFS